MRDLLGRRVSQNNADGEGSELLRARRPNQQINDDLMGFDLALQAEGFKVKAAALPFLIDVFAYVLWNLQQIENTGRDVEWCGHHFPSLELVYFKIVTADDGWARLVCHE